MADFRLCFVDTGRNRTESRQQPVMSYVHRTYPTMEDQPLARCRLHRSIRLAAVAAAAATATATTTPLFASPSGVEAFCGPASTCAGRRLPHHAQRRSSRCALHSIPTTSSNNRNRNGDGQGVASSSSSGSGSNSRWRRRLPSRTGSIRPSRRGQGMPLGAVVPLGTGGDDQYFDQAALGPRRDGKGPAPASPGPRAGPANGGQQAAGMQQQQQQQQRQQRRGAGGGRGDGRRRPFGHITDETLDLIRAQTSITEVIGQ